MTKSTSRFLKKFLILSAALPALSACGFQGYSPLRDDVADNISGPAWMIERQIEARPYELTAFERMHERGLPANLYIEGDGLADIMKKTVFFDPSPKNPVGLHLAAMDKSTNLAYLARPCQYSGMLDEEAKCESDTVKRGAFSLETLNAYNHALNKMKHRYTITEFNIIGYDSGATLAAILAASRPDVVSLRTVNGEFDLEALGSYQSALAHIPQHHFSGGQDYKNRPDQLHAYLQMIGQNNCTETTFIQEATHEQGFVNKWPDLLKKGLPTCAEPMPEFEPIDMPEPIYYPSIGDEKK